MPTNESAAKPPDDCDFPLDPEHGEMFSCYGCETLWEFDKYKNEWEAIGEAISEEVTDAKP